MPTRAPPKYCPFRWKVVPPAGRRFEAGLMQLAQANKKNRGCRGYGKRTRRTRPSRAHRHPRSIRFDLIKAGGALTFECDRRYLRQYYCHRVCDHAFKPQDAFPRRSRRLKRIPVLAFCDLRPPHFPVRLKTVSEYRQGCDTRGQVKPPTALDPPPSSECDQIQSIPDPSSPHDRVVDVTQHYASGPFCGKSTQRRRWSRPNGMGNRRCYSSSPASCSQHGDRRAPSYRRSRTIPPPF